MPQPIAAYTTAATRIDGSNSDCVLTVAVLVTPNILSKGAVNIPEIEYIKSTKPLFGFAPKSLSTNREISNISITPTKNQTKFDITVWPSAELLVSTFLVS